VEVHSTAAANDLKPITFSQAGQQALGGAETGAQPLDFERFESAKDSSRRKEAAVAPFTPAEPDWDMNAPATPLANVIGLVRLTKVLAWITSILWVATAALMVAIYLDLGVPHLAQLVAQLPFHVEALTVVPWLLLLATVLAASSAKYRVAAAVQRRASRIGALFRTLLWLLLAVLPGVGLLLGLGVGLYLIVRKRPVHLATPERVETAQYSEYDFATTDRPLGWTLIFFTLAWQEVLVVVVLSHYRAYLPW
jgi:hypothetical protein